MKRLIWILTTAWVVILTFSPADAQDIFVEEGNLYSTRQLSNSATIPGGSKVIIKSASTLQGQLKIIVAEGDKATVKYFKKAKAGSKSAKSGAMARDRERFSSG